MFKRLFAYFSKRTHKYKVGDQVVFVNDFGVAFLYTISELTTWTTVSGKVLPAYHHENTQTPWFPTEESRLRKAKETDKYLPPEVFQAKYGFPPRGWYGCR